VNNFEIEQKKYLNQTMSIPKHKNCIILLKSKKIDRKSPGAFADLKNRFFGQKGLLVKAFGPF
jgi:hypothetical protein